MDEGSLAWFKMHLRNRFLELKRDEFQQLVCTVLEQRYPGDFKRIRQGTRRGGGDGGCDGFRTSSGTAYAVYAPRETNSNALRTKIEGDLEKVKGLFGSNLREWVFVHNDSDGLNGDVVLETLLKLQQDNPTIKIGEHLSFNELWDIVRQLPFERVCQFLPAPPTPEDFRQRLPFESLRPVISYLQQAVPDEDVRLDPVSPDKLAYNELPVLWQDYIRGGRRLSGAVSTYLSGHHDPELGDRLASAFRSRYKSLQEQQLGPEDLCEQLFEFAGGFACTETNQHRAAVAAVLAYFFDRCDIFENVPSLPS